MFSFEISTVFQNTWVASPLHPSTSQRWRPWPEVLDRDQRWRLWDEHLAEESLRGAPRCCDNGLKTHEKGDIDGKGMRRG